MLAASFLPMFAKYVLYAVANSLASDYCIRRDGTLFDIKCAFNYSDIRMNISQVTPVAIQKQ